MPDATEPDVIRLSLPADHDLRGVVEVAVAVLARRLRFGDAAITAGRATAGAAFDELVGGDRQTTVEIELHVTDAALGLRLQADGAIRSIMIPDEAPSPPG